jgi:hypothetical protein
MMVTDAEYHLSFGLHSGIPLCCAIEFADSGNKGGPCPPCLEKGITKESLFAKYHHCDENTPACQPYLDIVEGKALEAYKEYRENHAGKLDYGTHSYRPLKDKLRELLKQDGFRMVHLCWPEVGYWYIFQQQGGKKGTCGICNKKFSLAFPTTGKQDR